MNGQMYAYSLRGGGKISVHWFGGGKNVVHDYRGGGRFECEPFSEFHCTPAANNDHSLTQNVYLCFLLHIGLYNGAHVQGNQSQVFLNREGKCYDVGGTCI